MGANSSKRRYEYNYGSPPPNYNNHYDRWKGAAGVQAAPHYGQVPNMKQMAYPSMYPRYPLHHQPTPQIVFPLLMQNMQQVSGSSAAQMQPMPQYQQYGQQPINAMQIQSQPVAQMPQPQMPQPQTSWQMPHPENQGFAQPFPQPQHPLTPDGPVSIPGPSVFNHDQGPVIPGPPIPAPGGRFDVGPPPVTPRSAGGEFLSPNLSSTSTSSSSGTDRPTANPLPEPPRDAPIPDHLLSGSAMAHISPAVPRHSSLLKNPLPTLPRDVYTLKKYRPLLVGTAYADNQKEVFPERWFSEGDGYDHEGGIGRALARLNPFRPQRGSEYTPGHRRYETTPEFARESSTGSGSEGSFASMGMRRNRLGRAFRMPFSRRRHDNEPTVPPPMEGPLPIVDERPPIGFMPTAQFPLDGAEAQGQPQPMQPFSPISSQPQPLTQPSNPNSSVPAQPQSEHPLSPAAFHARREYPRTPGPGRNQLMPQPNQVFSPFSVPPIAASQGPISPNANLGSMPPFRFNLSTPEYIGLTHISPHPVQYKRKSYPTAAHLFEAYKFLGHRNDLAELVRTTDSLSQLGSLLESLGDFVRHDWEDVLLHKMEDVLYRKFVQHSDLREIILSTGIADIVYAEPTDPFWGEGEFGQGENQLGRILMLVRERLRQEIANY